MVNNIKNKIVTKTKQSFTNVIVHIKKNKGIIKLESIIFKIGKRFFKFTLILTKVGIIINLGTSYSSADEIWWHNHSLKELWDLDMQVYNAYMDKRIKERGENSTKYFNEIADDLVLNEHAFTEGKKLIKKNIIDFDRMKIKDLHEHTMRHVNRIGLNVHGSTRSLTGPDIIRCIRIVIKQKPFAGALYLASAGSGGYVTSLILSDSYKKIQHMRRVRYLENTFNYQELKTVPRYAFTHTQKVVKTSCINIGIGGLFVLFPIYTSQYGDRLGRLLLIQSLNALPKVLVYYHAGNMSVYVSLAFLERHGGSIVRQIWRGFY